MNKRLMRNFKKAVVGIVIGASSLTTIIPGGYLFAATTNVMEQKASSVKIKDVTLTAKDIVPGEYKGSFIINMVMDKASGFPAHMEDMLITGKANVEIGGKKIELRLDHTTVTKKISNTQAEVAVYVFAFEIAENGGILCEAVKLDQLKGKELIFKIESITYNADYTTLTPEFLEQFKKVSTVSGIELGKANLELDQDELNHMDPNLKVIPHGGLAIPAVEGTSVILDNIGFVNGVLNIRIEHGKGEECCRFKLEDSKEKMVPSSFRYGGMSAAVYGYRISDVTTLANYVPKITLAKEIAKDEEKDKQGKVVVKTLNCKF